MIGAFLPRLVKLLQQTQAQAAMRAAQQAQAMQHPPGGMPSAAPSTVHPPGTATPVPQPVPPQGMPPQGMAPR
jgi:hypothetical protein